VCLGVPYIGPPRAPRRRWLAASLAAALLLGMAMLAVDEPVTLRVPAPLHDTAVRVMAVDVTASEPTPVAVTSLALPTERERRAVVIPSEEPRRAGILGSPLLDDLSRMTGDRDLYTGVSVAGQHGFPQSTPGFGEVLRFHTAAIAVLSSDIEVPGCPYYGVDCRPPPPPRPGPPALHIVDADPVTGETAEIRRALRHRSEALAACLAKKPFDETPHWVNARFVIAPDGHVAGATASGGDEVAECITEAILAVRFPAQRTSREATYRFALTADRR
jgi:hypothetical protein